jgi:hypothetical protein
MKYGLLDTSLDSENIGDQIIMESVIKQLNGMGVKISHKLPTHRLWSEEEFAMNAEVDFWIIGGTNLLGSYFPQPRQWKLNTKQFKFLENKIILLGVGWWKYQSKAWASSKFVYSRLLSSDMKHSVRDEYTLQKLKFSGFAILNTSCPTLWDISEIKSHYSTLPTKAVITLTAYNRDPLADKILVEQATSYFSEAVLWPQSESDIKYFDELKLDLPVEPATLFSLQQLRERGFAHFGTRLHAGIYFMQNGNPSAIAGIDNRAQEISTSSGLPIFVRGREFDIGEFFSRDYPIAIDHTAIAKFRENFDR